MTTTDTLVSTTGTITEGQPEADSMVGASSGPMKAPESIAETPLDSNSVLEKVAEGVVEVEEPKEDPKFSARFAALSRKEKELVQRERAFKENQAKLQAYEKALQTAKQNPLEYLQAAGLTLEEALQQIINSDGDQPVTEAQRLQQIEKKISDYEEQQVVARKQAAEYKKNQELNQIKSNITDYINNNSETYELIKEYNAIDDVWSVIERAFIDSRGQTHLTMEQASQLVEDQLYKEATEEAERIARIKKLNKNQQLTSTEDSIQVSNEEKVRQPSPTLTNQSATVSTDLKRFKSREESLADAAKLLKWK